MSTTAMAPPQAAPARRPLTPRRGIPTWVIAVLIGVPTLLIVVFMLGFLGTYPLNGSLSDVFRAMTDGTLIRFPQLLVANTPTGGDMGAHVLLPQVLRESVIPSGRLLGWSNAWYAGFPVLYFYFPLPALTTVLLDLVLPYGVAFKLTTIVGLVALPGVSYLFTRMMGFPRHTAGLAAVTGAAFLFMESYSIFGANIKSTLAGEFSFSWSFAFSILYLGVLIRDVREQRAWTPLAGILLGLTALSHIVTTMIIVVGTLPLLFRRGGPRRVLFSWLLGFGIAAFWAIPLGLGVLDGLTTDMGWHAVSALRGDQSPGSPLPGEFVPVAILGGVGMVWSWLRRDDVGTLAWLTLMPVAGYILLPLTGITMLYNARLLPYWYYGMFIFTAIALGLAASEIAKRATRHRTTLIVATLTAGLVVFVATLANIHDVPGWVKWNYEGYEGKAAYPEYQTLIEEIDALPPGRVMWEANSEMNKYGTPMALMLTGYWSEEHPSMEGLFFESSLTTPFHFLNAAEVSERPSNPVRGLEYRSFDIERALEHLALYDVAYYVSFTEMGETGAREAGLVEVGRAPPWTIFALPDSDLIDVASFAPAVWAGGGDFQEAALAWYDDVEHLDRWLVEDGLDEWPTVAAVEDRLSVNLPYTRSGEVSNLVVEDHRISFTTTAVGVPHLVKVSYFPNWRAEGAEGPFRAAPSLMVVVPTEPEVVLEFRNTAAENIGIALTVLAIGGLIAYAYLRRRERRERTAA